MDGTEIDKHLFESARCSLESLVLRDVDLNFEEDDLRLFIRKFPNLKVLDFHGLSLLCTDFINVSHLSELSLKVLDLGEASEVAFCMDSVCNLFANHSPLSQSIQELDLSRVLDDSGADVTHLALNRMAASCSNLVKLKLDDFFPLRRKIKFSTYFTPAHFPHLKELSLVNTKAKGFHNCHMPTLERLKIGGFATKMTDHAVHSILLGCPALVFLYAEEFNPSHKFFPEWAKIGRNCERAWEAPLELVCNLSSEFIGCHVELRKYLGLAWKIRAPEFIGKKSSRFAKRPNFFR